MHHTRMAPSRGLMRLRTALGTRSLSSRASFASRAITASPLEPGGVQSYVSRSTDPYLNLAIEDHLLRTSPHDAAILFLYTNRPCVVIGRNQNPWLETDLGLLTAGRTTTVFGLGNIDLVRRRSGGGTVFHDEGNVNWSIISPRATFTRDKHVEMVVRALRSLGVHRARVNERHDIVLDQGTSKHGRTDAYNTHSTLYTTDVSPPLKVSGSAYKLIKGRALHHGTCLLNSEYLNFIPCFLRSKSRQYLQAKGVESVGSPITNVGIEPDAFMEAVHAEFSTMYLDSPNQLEVRNVDESHLEVPEIRKGCNELAVRLSCRA